MPFVENFAAYMVDFGAQATLNGRAVRVIFENRHADAFDLSMNTSTPQAGLSTAVPEELGAAQGSTLTIGTTAYRVTSVQPDGTGWTTLKLQEAVA